jgi:hypothetical protein
VVRADDEVRDRQAAAVEDLTAHEVLQLRRNLLQGRDRLVQLVRRRWVDLSGDVKVVAFLEDADELRGPIAKSRLLALPAEERAELAALILVDTQKIVAEQQP